MACRRLAIPIGPFDVTVDIEEQLPSGRTYSFRSTFGEGALKEPFRYESKCTANEAWDLLEAALAGADILAALLDDGKVPAAPHREGPSLRLLKQPGASGALRGASSSGKVPHE